MSVNYAAGLSNFPHIDKGRCGLPEIQEPADVLQSKINELVELIKQSKHFVVHTGAGISTTAGIPDFRGPKGVWTLEKQGKSPHTSINFEEAIPTKTHMVILALQQRGIIKYVVSQNIDGLHVRSGFPRCQLSELHGNMFVEKCEKCNHEYFRRRPVATMTQKRTGNLCMQKGKRGLSGCRGKLRDTILDWEDSLPTTDLINAEYESKRADLSLCLGSTLQVVPSGKLPLLTLKNTTGGGKLVIVNLQKTQYDKKANISIRAYVDDVMMGVLKGLGLNLPKYNPELYLSTTTLYPEDVKKADDDVKKNDNEQIKHELYVDEELAIDYSKEIKTELIIESQDNNEVKSDDKTELIESQDNSEVKSDNKTNNETFFQRHDSIEDSNAVQHTKELNSDVDLTNSYKTMIDSTSPSKKLKLDNET